MIDIYYPKNSCHTMQIRPLRFSFCCNLSKIPIQSFNCNNLDSKLKGHAFSLSLYSHNARTLYNMQTLFAFGWNYSTSHVSIIDNSSDKKNKFCLRFCISCVTISYFEKIGRPHFTYLMIKSILCRNMIFNNNIMDFNYNFKHYQLSQKWRKLDETD